MFDWTSRSIAGLISAQCLRSRVGNDESPWTRQPTTVTRFPILVFRERPCEVRPRVAFSTC